MNAVHYSSEHQDWNTPACVLDRVRRVAEIGLDPCSNEQSIVNARVEYRLSRGQDGLVLPWDVGGLVFVNPPYSDEIGPFIRRADTCGLNVIALVPHRTDTAWYQDGTVNLRAKCEWRGRLKHMRGVADQRQLGLLGAANDSLEHELRLRVGEGVEGATSVLSDYLQEQGRPLATEGDTCAPFPSVVLCWGRSFHVERFADAFSSAGKVWVR